MLSSPKIYYMCLDKVVKFEPSSSRLQIESQSETKQNGETILASKSQHISTTNISYRSVYAFKCFFVIDIKTAKEKEVITSSMAW